MVVLLRNRQIKNEEAQKGKLRTEEMDVWTIRVECRLGMMS